MLQTAIDAEVDAFIETYQHRRDEQGRRLVVKNGSLPTREILTGAGSIQVKQGRVRDNASAAPRKTPQKTGLVAPTRKSPHRNAQVAEAGLEPARPLRTRDFKSRASANSATRPNVFICRLDLCFWKPIVSSFDNR